MNQSQKITSTLQSILFIMAQVAVSKSLESISKKEQKQALGIICIACGVALFISHSNNN